MHHSCPSVIRSPTGIVIQGPGWQILLGLCWPDCPGATIFRQRAGARGSPSLAPVALVGSNRTVAEADDPLGATREDPSFPLNEAYREAFEAIDADSETHGVTLAALRNDLGRAQMESPEPHLAVAEFEAALEMLAGDESLGARFERARAHEHLGHLSFRRLLAAAGWI